METYKLSEDAKNDLIRIHQHGVISFGEAQADKYYMAFFERFEQLVEQPYGSVANVNYWVLTPKA